MSPSGADPRLRTGVLRTWRHLPRSGNTRRMPPEWRARSGELGKRGLTPDGASEGLELAPWKEARHRQRSADDRSHRTIQPSGRPGFLLKFRTRTASASAATAVLLRNFERFIWELTQQ